MNTKLKLPIKKQLKILTELRQTIPDAECKGLCHQACGIVPFAPIENAAIKNQKPIKTTTCPYLDENNQCSEYENRPIMCRLYGVSENLTCQFGCKVQVSSQQASDIIKKYSLLFGGPTLQLKAGMKALAQTDISPSDFKMIKKALTGGL